MGDEIATVRMPASLDTNSAGVTLDELDGAINRGATKVVCDFSRTDYISSVGIGILMVAFKKLRKSGGELILSALKPKVRSVLDITGLTKIIPIRETASL